MPELCLEPTSPFGDRALTLRDLRRQRELRQAAEAAAGCVAHKWKAFRHLCVAKAEFRLSDRTLAVLEALLTFHPDTVLTVGVDDLVVFPSNRQLSLRAQGMATSTLRRHLAALVDRGLIFRRDSANGKRFVRRDSHGNIEEAFGFDLGPFVLCAEEFEQIAAAVEARRRLTARMRGRISIARRDIVKMIAVGVEAGIAADWPDLHRQLHGITPGLSRPLTPESLEPILTELNRLARYCLALLEASPSDDEPSCFGQAGEPQSASAGAGAKDEGEAEGSDPSVGPISREREAELRADPDVEKAPVGEPFLGERDGAAPVEESSGPPMPSSCPQPESAISGVPLAFVLAACPDIHDYARDGIQTFRDLCATADLVRRLLGITPDAWDEACRVMGREGAAIVVAALLQRGVAIKNPGGYLRTLTRRAAAGRFSVWPMLTALDAAHRKARAAEDLQESSIAGSRPIASRCA